MPSSESCSMSSGSCPRWISHCRSSCRSSFRQRSTASATRSPETIPTPSCSTLSCGRSMSRPSALVSLARCSLRPRLGRSTPGSQRPRSLTLAAIRGGCCAPACWRRLPCGSASRGRPPASCSPRRSSGRESEVWLVAGDLGEDAVEVVAGEGPLERPGDSAVVLAKREQALLELVERAEVVGRERLALDDREEQLGLVEPGG